MFLILIGSHHKREIIFQQFPVHEVVRLVEKNVQILPKNKNLISPTASVKIVKYFMTQQNSLLHLSQQISGKKKHKNKIKHF